MSPINLLNTFINQLLTGLGLNADAAGAGEKNEGVDDLVPPTPSQIMVIAGILGGVLAIKPIQVGWCQVASIVLTGDLKQKSQLDHIMEQRGKMLSRAVLSKVLEFLG